MQRGRLRSPEPKGAGLSINLGAAVHRCSLTWLTGRVLVPYPFYGMRWLILAVPRRPASKRIDKRQGSAVSLLDVHRRTSQSKPCPASIECGSTLAYQAGHDLPQVCIRARNAPTPPNVVACQISNQLGSSLPGEDATGHRVLKKTTSGDSHMGRRSFYM